MTVCHREEQVIMNSSSCTNCALVNKYARQCVRGSRGCKWGPLGSRAQGLVGRQALECICGRQLCFMRCVAQQVGDKSGKNHGCKYDECFYGFLSLLAFHWKKMKQRLSVCECCDEKELKMLLWRKQTLTALLLSRRRNTPPPPPKPHASGSYLSSTSQNIFSCGFMRLVASLSAADGNPMSRLFTLHYVVLDPPGFNMPHTYT